MLFVGAVPRLFKHYQSGTLPQSVKFFRSIERNSLIFSTVNYQDGFGVLSERVYANTDMMNLFLEEVSKDFKDYFVIMLVDGAGWHRSGGLKVPENIKLIYQPSHSPELNPVEHLWEELREKHLPNRAFRPLDAVERALCEGLCKLHDDPARLRSMSNFEYLQITN